MKKLSENTTLKIDTELLEQVKRIAQNKYPLRKIEFYSEAVREALIEFIKKNSRYNNKPESKQVQSNSNNQQKQIESV